MILKHNHRQGEGCKWANVLNEFRLGKVSDENFALIEERVTEDPHLDFNSMHLSYTNPEVQDINDKMLNRLETELVSIPAIKKYPKGRKPTIQKDGRIENRNIMNVLKLKIGARCVLTTNLDTADELSNGGACGTIIGLEFKDGSIDCIIVKFDKPSCGKNLRSTKYPRLVKKYESQNGTPIFRTEIEIQLSSKGGKNLGSGSVARVVQFPIMIYYGSTAHRIQVLPFFFRFSNTLSKNNIFAGKYSSS